MLQTHTLHYSFTQFTHSCTREKITKNVNVKRRKRKQRKTTGKYAHTDINTAIKNVVVISGIESIAPIHQYSKQTRCVTALELKHFSPSRINMSDSLSEEVLKAYARKHVVWTYTLTQKIAQLKRRMCCSILSRF